MTGTRQGTDETLQNLVSKLNGVDAPEVDRKPTARTEAVVEETAEAVYEGRGLEIDEGLVKQSLPELLTALIGLRNGDINGKGVMDDLEEFFDADLSPGTVYPVLHELEDEELLSVHELVQTKEYSIDDGEAAHEKLEASMGQHLALGLVFRQALEEFDD